MKVKYDNRTSTTTTTTTVTDKQPVFLFQSFCRLHHFNETISVCVCVLFANVLFILNGPTIEYSAQHCLLIDTKFIRHFCDEFNYHRQSLLIRIVCLDYNVTPVNAEAYHIQDIIILINLWWVDVVMVSQSNDKICWISNQFSPLFAILSNLTCTVLCHVMYAIGPMAIQWSSIVDRKNKN